MGTAEQIALLQISRGLRNTSIITQEKLSNHQCRISDDINCVTSDRENSQCNIEMSNSAGQSTCNNNYTYHISNTSDRYLVTTSCKNQEIQTNISVFKDKTVSEPSFQEDMISCGSIDRSTNACTLYANRITIDQTTQTEIEPTEEQKRVEEKMNREELCLNRLNSNVLSDDNDSCSPRNNFQLPTEMYRSVGVGAEYNEELDQQQTNVYNNHLSPTITEENTEKNESNSNSDGPFFRSIVEIECALYLPKIERLNESVEPSTYVTFQNVTLKSDSSSRSNAYMITNIYPHNCNPKWNWRCHTKLPMELLLNVCIFICTTHLLYVKRIYAFFMHALYKICFFFSE